LSYIIIERSQREKDRTKVLKDSNWDLVSLRKFSIREPLLMADSVSLQKAAAENQIPPYRELECLLK